MNISVCESKFFSSLRGCSFNSLDVLGKLLLLLLLLLIYADFFSLDVELRLFLKANLRYNFNLVRFSRARDQNKTKNTQQKKKCLVYVLYGNMKFAIS
jgi:hypothetical protein